MIKGSPRTFITALALVPALLASPALADTATTTFDITMTIEDACTIAAGTVPDVALGTHAASETNIAGNTAITVNCSKTTPYYIGLLPSNNDTSGAGELSGTGGNTDKVPYQLRSTTGAAGTIWGNTATTTSVGNGVAGTGTGADETHTVYVTVPSANFTPDDYLDTVTVTVNY